jgi:hypothetical protein
VKKQTITLFLIISLLSSILSVALTSSGQVNQSLGEESKGDKPKETKSESKSDTKSKDKDKPKKEPKTKQNDKKSENEDKTKEDDNNKKDDTSATSTDNPSNPPIADTSSSTSDSDTSSSTSDSDTSSLTSTNLDNPTPTPDPSSSTTSSTPLTSTTTPVLTTPTISEPPITPIDQTITPNKNNDAFVNTNETSAIEITPKTISDYKNSTESIENIKNTSMPLFVQPPIPTNTTGSIPTNTTGSIPLFIPSFYCNTYPIAYHYDKNNNCVLNSNCWDGPIDIKTNSTTVYCIEKGSTKHYTIHNSQHITNNYYTYNYPNTLSGNVLQYQGTSLAKYILLLDIKQICLVAGNFNCVAQQNQFATSSLNTTFDAINKVWSIFGTVKDVSKVQLNNVQVTALFYDGKGNPISKNPITSSVNPNIINPSEDATFAFNVFANSDLNGANPLYIVLIYSQQQNLNANSAPIQNSGQQQNLNANSAPIQNSGQQQNLNANSAPIQNSGQQQNLNANGGLAANQFGPPDQTVIPISTKSDIKAILEPNPDFIVKGISVTQDSINDLVVVGEIQNTAQLEQQNVKVILTAYDANNAILTTDITYTEPLTLQSGQTGPFKDYLTPESVGGDINSIKSLKIALSSG